MIVHLMSDGFLGRNREVGIRPYIMVLSVSEIAADVLEMLKL
jgi:hypothetical protein